MIDLSRTVPSSSRSGRRVTTVQTVPPRRLTAPLRRIARDAASESLNPTQAMIAFWFPVVGGIVLAGVHFVSGPAYYWLTREDHVIEWAQFGLCLIGGFVAVAAALNLARRGNKTAAIFICCAVLGCFVLAGEEISWGQRLFGIAEPSALGNVNVQSELNLHNVETGILPLESISENVELLIGLIGAALALAIRQSRPLFRARTWWLLSPPLLTVPGFLLEVVYKLLADADAPGFGTKGVIFFEEWVELGLYLSVTITLICCYRRSRAWPARVDGGRRARSVSDHTVGPEVPAWPPLVLVACAAAAIVTVIFALLTIRSGVAPVNV